MPPLLIRVRNGVRLRVRHLINIHVRGYGVASDPTIAIDYVDHAGGEAGFHEGYCQDSLESESGPGLHSNLLL